MNTPLFPVAIYPSQLGAFKTKAELLSTSISEALSIKKLSSFKRNDYLAIALGYKGHPDLVESSKFRVSSDKEQQLLIFSNEAIRQSIAEVFSSKLTNISANNVLLVCEGLEKSELGSLVLSDTRQMLEGSLVNKLNPSKADINPMLFFDEVGNSPEALEQRQGAAKFLTEQDIKNTPKKSNINIVIDLSEVPISIGEEFYEHRQWLKFESEVKLRNRKHNVIFKFLEPATKEGEKKHWKIRTSIDTWSQIEPTSNFLTVWSEFKDWLMSFFATERIHVTERINSHRWKTPVVQFPVSNPVEHQLSKLTKLEDITLFNLLAIRKGQYGEIFNNEVADIDLKEVLARNKNINVNLDAFKKIGSSGQGKHPLSSLVESALKAQRKDVAQAKQAFDKRWTEKSSLWNEQDMKDHVDAIGQGNGKSLIGVNLEQTLFAPVLTDSSLKDLIHMIESRWPEGATCATQECDGEILFWSAPIENVIKARKEADLEEGLMPLIGIGQQIHANYYEINEQSYVAFDWQTAVVTQAQISFI